MASEKATIAPLCRPQFLEGFEPLTVLWQGPNPLYPSEQSTRWAVRTLGAKLADAQAVAVHRRALMVHPQRFASVVEREAIERFKQRTA